MGFLGAGSSQLDTGPDGASCGLEGASYVYSAGVCVGSGEEDCEDVG